MSKFKYEQIDPVIRAEAVAALQSDDERLLVQTLIAIGLHDDDWRWVQEQALRFLAHTNPEVVSAAILSIAHTSRVHRTIDKLRVVPALQALSADPRFAGKVQDALDDIEMFVKQY